MSSSSRSNWGIAEAMLAWPASAFVGTLSYVAVLQLGGFSASIPQRPGGHLGRSAAQLAQGEELRDETLPIIWQMFLLAPGWIVLLAVCWFFAAALGHDRLGWSLKGKLSDIPLGAAAGVVMSIPLLFVVMFIVQLIFGEIEQSGRALALVDLADTWPKVVVLVAFVGIGAPVVEEMFYRGVVQGWLVRRFGAAVGIGAAAIVFGVVHLSLIEFAPLVSVGAVLGILFWKTGRLLPSIIGHMTFNMLTIVNLLVASRSR